MVGGKGVGTGLRGAGEAVATAGSWCSVLFALCVQAWVLFGRLADDLSCKQIWNCFC